MGFVSSFFIEASHSKPLKFSTVIEAIVSLFKQFGLTPEISWLLFTLKS